MVFISRVLFGSLKSTQPYPFLCSKSVPSFSRLLHYVLYVCKLLTKKTISNKEGKKVIKSIASK